MFATKPIRAKSVALHLHLWRQNIQKKKTAYSQLDEESKYGREHTDGENRKLVVDPKHKILNSGTEIVLKDTEIAE